MPISTRNVAFENIECGTLYNFYTETSCLIASIEIEAAITTVRDSMQSIQTEDGKILIGQGASPARTAAIIVG